MPQGGRPARGLQPSHLSQAWERGCPDGRVKGFDGPDAPCLPLGGAACPHVPAAGPVLSPGCWNQPLEKCVLGNSTGM